MEPTVATLFFAAILCLYLPPRVLSNTDYLPTIFWNENSPALDSRHWSKVTNVKLFQTITFLCPTNYINFARYRPSSSKTGSYYNLYVRELSPNDTNLNYSTICDPKESKSVFFCNVSRNEIDLSSKIVKQFTINTFQARDIPSFKEGKDYIFFSTSDGRQETLVTRSTKCTMVFRIHFCDKGEICPIPSCSTYGREEVCMPKPKTETTKTSAPRDVRITANTITSLSLSWKENLATKTNITYYEICYRTSSSQDCMTKIIKPHVRSTTLKNLNASTVYRIRIRAYTCEGPGNYSQEISRKTSEEPVDKPSNASEPRAVIASGATDSSFTLSWKEPANIGSGVIYYNICFKEDKSEECITKLVEPNERSTKLNNLNGSTKYGIRIRAHTCTGPGQYSEEISLETTEISEGPISSPRACDDSFIHVGSLLIGLGIGIILTVLIAVFVWLVTAERRKQMAKPVRNIANRGFRRSVSDTLNRNYVKSSDNNVELKSV